MFCREPKKYSDDCYFCLVNIIGINRNNCNKWTYPDLDFAKRTALHSEKVPIQHFTSLLSSVRMSPEALILPILKKVTVILRRYRHQLMNLNVSRYARNGTWVLEFKKEMFEIFFRECHGKEASKVFGDLISFLISDHCK